jgi:cell wall assembly regulator SMI1
MADADMQNTFAKLEAELSRQFPSVLKKLNPPASLDQVEAFEAATEQKLPQDIKAAYLWHDGCSPQDLDLGLGGDEEQYFLIGRYRWCSLDEMLTKWHLQNEIAFGDDYFFTEEDDPEQWQSAESRPWTCAPPTWLPVGRYQWDSWVYIDLLPGPQGHVGQLVECSILTGQSVIAQSMATYFSALLNALDRREIAYDHKNHRWFNKINNKDLPYSSA